ncbi:hypothetical protein MSAN_00555400 [Mycena sanguinolenta]|uniref:Uncharacterized protein n=1 Tax=Mycena sanguinolenta TaxID=230812 RepID=A0A8H6Z9J7_9AGAR|nr:hypothetical protein MSAN_00555400 [Mycena sanguinolenta]
MHPSAARSFLKPLLRVRSQSLAVVRAGNRRRSDNYSRILPPHIHNKTTTRAFSFTPTPHDRKKMLKTVALQKAEIQSLTTEIASGRAKIHASISQIESIKAEADSVYTELRAWDAEQKSLQEQLEDLRVVTSRTAPIVLDASLTTLSFAVLLIAIRDAKGFAREEALTSLHQLRYIHETQILHIPEVLPASNIDILQLSSSLLSQNPAQPPPTKPFSQEIFEELRESMRMRSAIPPAKADLLCDSLLKAHSLPDDYEVTLGQFLFTARFQIAEEKAGRVPPNPDWQEAIRLWGKVAGTRSLKSTKFSREELAIRFYSILSDVDKE